MSSESVQEVIIVGSGPAGYTAAVYAARADLKPLVFESEIAAGGALMTTTEVENFPGFRDAIMGPELMDNMRAQAERFGARWITEMSSRWNPTGDIKVVKDGYGNTFSARAVILAMGSDTASSTLRGKTGWRDTASPGVPPATAFSSVTRTLPVGGGDSAVEEATFLTRFAKSVTIVHRRDELRASKIMAARAFNNPKIKFAWNSVTLRSTVTRPWTSITLQDTITGAERELPVSRAVHRHWSRSSIGTCEGSGRLGSRTAT